MFVDSFSAILRAMANDDSRELNDELTVGNTSNQLQSAWINDCEKNAILISMQESV